MAKRNNKQANNLDLIDKLQLQIVLLKQEVMKLQQQLLSNDIALFEQALERKYGRKGERLNISNDGKIQRTPIQPTRIDNINTDE